MIEKEYWKAFLIPCTRVSLRLVKKLTVIGIIENTQGVINAINPPPKQARKIHHKDLLEASSAATPSFATSSPAFTAFAGVPPNAISNVASSGLISSPFNTIAVIVPLNLL